MVRKSIKTRTGSTLVTFLKIWGLECMFASDYNGFVSWINDVVILRLFGILSTGDFIESKRKRLSCFVSTWPWGSANGHRLCKASCGEWLLWAVPASGNPSTRDGQSNSPGAKTRMVNNKLDSSSPELKEL